MGKLSRFSFNILGNGGDEGYTLDTLAAYNVAGALVLDGDDLAQKLKDRLPDALIVARKWTQQEGGEWLHNTPDQRVNEWLHLDRRLIRYDCNEPAVNAQSASKHAAWIVEVMHRAAAKGIKVCVGNFATGHVQPEWISGGHYDEVIRLLATDYRGVHYLGLHEYSIGLAPWGVGLWQPETLWDKTRTMPVSQWPTMAACPPLQKIDDNFHYWFYRRGDLWSARARELGLPPADIILTEWGWDNVWIGRDPSIQQEIQNLYGASGFPNVRGPNTLRKCWAALYPEYSFVDMLMYQYRWAAQIYPPEYKAVCQFGWYTTGGWKTVYGCNLGGRENAEFHQALIAAANAPDAPEPLPPPTPEPPPIPVPDPCPVPDPKPEPGGCREAWRVLFRR